MTGATTSEDERHMASRKGFHDVLEAVKSSRNGICHKDLGRVSFFHSIRNKLYHQGNGLTVTTDNINEYINVTIRLLKNLLKLDITPLISPAGLSATEQALVLELKQQININLISAKELKTQLNSTIELVAETIEQSLVMPSFKKKFIAIQDSAYTEEGTSFHENKYITYKKLPHSTEERMTIVEKMRGLCDSIFKKSQFSEVLLKNIELKNAPQEKTFQNILGIKNVSIEHEIIPSAYSIVFEQYFSLESFYLNIVSLVLYKNNYLPFYLSNITYEIENFAPIYYDENEVDYWNTIKNTSEEQLSDLNNYIDDLNHWLDNVE